MPRGVDHDSQTPSSLHTLVMLRRTGVLGGVASLLLGSLNMIEQEDMVPHTVRFDDESLLSSWTSEEIGADDMEPECRFYNGSVSYESALCSHFVISRAASTPRQAYMRAKRCAARFDSSCVLSAEIGLAIPAAFFVRSADVDMVLAPKILDASDVQKVRVHDPSSSFSSRTYHFNRTLIVEHMDGATRSIKREEYKGNDAYCIQLLRRSFASSCWDALD